MRHTADFRCLTFSCNSSKIQIILIILTLISFFRLKPCKPCYKGICKSSYVNHLLSKSSYEELLEKNVSVSIQHRSIQALAIGMQKVRSGNTPWISSDLFNRREISPYNLRRHHNFRVPLTRTVHHGIESISYLSPKT